MQGLRDRRCHKFHLPGEALRGPFREPWRRTEKGQKTEDDRSDTSYVE